MTTELPPLPEPRTLSRGDEDGPIQLGYTADQLRAYAAEAVRLARQQALEDAALLCDRRFLQGGDDDAVSVEMASAIRDLKDRT